jgi:hypothetical protein
VPAVSHAGMDAEDQARHFANWVEPDPCAGRRDNRAALGRPRGRGARAR